MRSEDKFIAVLAGDLHLSHKPPIARSVEKDWYGVQSYYLDILNTLCATYEIPLILSGDIFDTPTVPHELVNFVMGKLPDRKALYGTYAVAGQHDLKDHNFSDYKKTAFGTLVESGTINLLDPDTTTRLSEDWVALGFSWGQPIYQLKRKEKHGDKFLAVVHQYIWSNKHNSFPGAPESANLHELKKQLRNYDTAVFGDNHKWFYYTGYEDEYDISINIWNGGTFMRRKMDEIDYTPCVGLLCNSGLIERYELDCEQDKFIDADSILEVAEKGLDAAEFLEEFSGLGRKLVDFADAVEKFCIKAGIPDRIKQLLHKAME